MQIGIAGIGKMGAAIALRLIEVGHTITVWNRSPEKVKPIAAAGAAVAATPAVSSPFSPMPPPSRRSMAAPPDCSLPMFGENFSWR